MDGEKMNEEMLEAIQNAVMEGDRDGVVKLTKSSLEEGIEIKRILDEGLVAAMEVVGGRFKCNSIFIPEVLISAKAMHAGMAVLEPYFAKCGIEPMGNVVIGTVKGDLHDIGKNIVSMMLKGACFKVNDFGIDVGIEKFVGAVKNDSPDLIAMSALLTTSMHSMRDVINALKDSGLRDKVKIIVGGAPVTQDFADSIGADGYAKDALTAVDKAKELCGKP